MNEPYVINVQKFSVHDGDGVRTTIFFKGCLLSCKWCHNPESQSFTKDLMYYQERCTGCGMCIEVCPKKAVTRVGDKVTTNRKLCEGCGVCTDYCVNNAREIAGERYTVSQLINMAEKDRIFYEQSHGGITLSGGEVMIQNNDFIVELARKLKKKGYNIAIDTCGQAPTENYERILPYVDMFLYDVKVIDKEKHIKYIGKPNDLILKNLKFISDNGACINIRIPVIGGVNDNEKDMQDIIDWLEEHEIKVYRVNLLPYHNTGSGKYGRLEIPYEGDDFYKPSKEAMEGFKKMFEDANITTTVKIGG